MKQNQDQKLFLQEFKNHINSESQKKRERLLEMLENAEGILKKYPESVKLEFLSIANREGEEDREDSSL